MIIDFYLQSILIILLFFSALRDWKEGIIPNQYLIRGIGIRILLLLHEISVDGTDAIERILIKTGIALLLLGIGLLVRKMTHNGIGMGDIKLFSVMYLYMDMKEWMTAVFCSFAVGMMAAVFVKLKDRKRVKLPFAPAIFVGTLSAVLFTYMS